MRTMVASLAAWLAFAPPAALAADVVQITDDGAADRHPAISGSKVVWEHCDGGTSSSCDGGDWEIYFWDGSFPIPPIQITNNDTADWFPAISGSIVVWQGWDGNDFELYLWDGSFPVAPVQITDNGKDDQYPALSGSKLAWQQCDTAADPLCSRGDTEIYFWDGSFPIVPTRITDNEINDTMPAISGTKIVWEGYPDVVPVQAIDIYFWDGGAISRITDDGTLDWRPDISGSTAVWVGSPQIVRWDGSSPVVLAPAPGSTGGFLPAISASNVVYQKGPFGSSDIYLWDGGTTTNVSNAEAFQDEYPDVSGQTVVWQRCFVDPDLGCLAETSEIYMATVAPAPGVPSISPLGLLLLAGLIVATATCIAGRRTLGGRRRPLA